jgi:hypothetical protein
MSATYLRMGLWLSGAVAVALIVMLVARWRARRAGRTFQPLRVAGKTMVGLSLAVALLAPVFAFDFAPVLLTGAVLLLLGRHRPARVP